MNEMLDKLSVVFLIQLSIFIALAAILFNVAESFVQFWYRVTQETFLYNYFTRIPRNAVSRLPALFHKIEVNL